MSYLLSEIPLNKLRDLLKINQTVIIPVGLIEQHGHHLPLGTDLYNTSELLRIGAERFNAFVAPTLSYCFSGGELPGTMNTNPQMFGVFLSDICSEFVRNGFKNIIVLLGHGGTDNLAALKNGLQMLLRRDQGSMSDVALCLVPVYELSKTWMDALCTKPEADFHAGLVETSLMLYWKPELVRERIDMDDEYAARMMRTDQDWFEHREKVFDHPFVVEKVSQREEVKVGVMGFPERATAEFGRKICGEMIDGLSDFINKLNKR